MELTQYLFKRTVPRDFLLQVFFHESSSPKPLKITVGSFRIFSKIRGDIRKSRCTSGINDIGGKLPPVSRTPAVNLPPAGCSIACTVHGRFYGLYSAGFIYNLYYNLFYGPFVGCLLPVLRHALLYGLYSGYSMACTVGGTHCLYYELL
jgi:hypothetical protein